MDEQSSINWDALWKAAQRNYRNIRPNQWDSMAPALKRWMSNDEYFRQFMANVRLCPEWTVLDVGCGPGDITIWAAKRSKHVTALDFSSEMLRLLKETATKECLTNIDCIQCSWEDDRLDSELDKHDVVIASRSLATMANLKEGLARIDDKTKHYAYVTMGAGFSSPLKKMVYKVMGKEISDPPGYIYAYNLLYQMGIRANVKFIEGRSRYIDLNDALEQCRWIAEDLRPSEEKEITRLLNDCLIKRQDGILEFPYNDICWALMWWEKF